MQAVCWLWYIYYNSGCAFVSLGFAKGRNELKSPAWHMLYDHSDSIVWISWPEPCSVLLHLVRHFCRANYHKERSTKNITKWGGNNVLWSSRWLRAAAAGSWCPVRVQRKPFVLSLIRQQLAMCANWSQPPQTLSNPIQNVKLYCCVWEEWLECLNRVKTLSVLDLLDLTSL